MITNKALVQAMRTYLIRPNIYRNDFPYNCGYYDGQYISADCINSIKSIIWNSDIVDNYEVGKYSYAPNAVMGDWTERQIYDHCTEKGTDISKAPIGAYLLYEDEGHAGIYLGSNQAIEMTQSWNACKMVITDVGKNGERSLNGVKWGRWKAWGKLPGVEYIVDPVPVKNEFHKGDKVKAKKDAKVYGQNTLFIPEFYEATHTVFEEPTSDRIVIINENYGINPVNVSDLTAVKEAAKPAALKVGDRVKLKNRQDVNGTWIAIWVTLKKLEVQGFWEDGSVVIGQVGKSYPECVMHPRDIERA